MRKIGNYGLALMTVIALGSGVGLTAHAGSVSKTVTSNFTSVYCILIINRNAIEKLTPLL